MAEFREEIEKAARLILKAKYVVALVGAGISVESGIPPFPRSRRAMDQVR